MINPAASQSRERAQQLLDRSRAAVTAELRQVLDPLRFPLYGFMRYHLGWETAEGVPVNRVGGKMLRPALCLACCEAAGGRPETALPAAAALELFHNFTLVHDDIEDASHRRHGRRTVWSIWGTAHGVNTGDGLFALAERTLLRLTDRGVPPERVLRAAAVLNEACLRLCEGQYLDLSFEERQDVTRPEYMAMIEGKTASLMAASAMIGALAGGAPGELIDALERFGRSLGLAFQVQDDLLGVWGLEEDTGKPGADIRDRKKSFPVVYALESAETADRMRLADLYRVPELGEPEVAEVLAILDRCGARAATTREAERLAADAIETLASLDLAPEPRQDLIALARFVVERER